MCPLLGKVVPARLSLQVQMTRGVLYCLLNVPPKHSEGLLRVQAVSPPRHPTTTEERLRLTAMKPTWIQRVRNLTHLLL